MPHLLSVRLGLAQQQKRDQALGQGLISTAARQGCRTGVVANTMPKLDHLVELGGVGSMQAAQLGCRLNGLASELGRSREYEVGTRARR